MLSDSDNTFKTKKAFINGFEEEFARLTDCRVIDISKRFYADDRFALGGAHIVHYEDEFYSQCCKHITAFLAGADSRYTDKVDEEYIALRDMKIK
jgi:poly-gamma-glutamate synthesis protein (capsule biosynthesis protein)